MNTFTNRLQTLIWAVFCIWTSYTVHGQQTIDNAVIGKQFPNDNVWAGLRHSSLSASAGNYALIQNNSGSHTLINKANTGNGHIGFRVGNADLMVLLNNGRVGIGTTTPSYLLHVAGGDVFSNWFRSSGNNGWYNETHGGGIYMADGHWIRTYGGKNFYHDRGAMRTDGTLQVGPDGNTLSVVNNGGFNYGKGKMVMGTDGILQISNLAGIGDRPVYADANGKLKIGSGGTVVGAGINQQLNSRFLNIFNHFNDEVFRISSSPVTYTRDYGVTLHTQKEGGNLLINTWKGQMTFATSGGSSNPNIVLPPNSNLVQLSSLAGSGDRPVFATADGTLKIGNSGLWSGTATSDLNIGSFKIVRSGKMQPDINQIENGIGLHRIGHKIIALFSSDQADGQIVVKGNTNSDIELRGSVRNWNINNSGGKLAIQTFHSSGAFNKAPLVIHENGVAAIELKVKVDAKTAYPDFVFEPDYDLMPLSTLESYLKENKHLPEVKSVAEVVADDSQINVAEYTLLLLKKVEELTLYTIQQQKELDALKKQISNK